MTYEVITERTIEGLGDVFVYINDISGGLFINVLLTVIFLAILLGLLITQIKREGYADFPLSLATASLITAVMLVMFNLVDGLVSPTTRLIVVAITLMSALFFLFSRR